nr:RNA-directed DNA polymerase, eukaryota [Tanacetum cinerariifolium]
MVGDNMSRHKAWDDIILKIKSRLSKWKVKTLSIGGRLTLLKSVLGASPIYVMSIFTVPRGVLKALESIRNHFFNGADQSDYKITWVAWDKVLASKKKGGLGVLSFFALNRALLLKWVWQFVSQDGSLWCKVINALYGSKVDSHQTHYSSNWCSILREVHKLKYKGFDFCYHIKKRIGNGADTRFCDFLLFEEADAFLGLEDDPDSSELDPSYYDPEGDILLHEAILNSDPLPPLPNHEQSVPSFKHELKACEAKTIQSSIDEPPEVQLKDLPPYL